MYIMSSFNYILIIFLALNISIWRSNAQTQPSGFRVVLRWPPALCKIDPWKCSNLVREFTLHGMWPYNTKGASMTDCYTGTSDFNASKLATFRSGLDTAWPSFGGSNEDFWEYEWDKHGRCAESLLSFENYFRNAMNTRNYLKLEQTLSTKGGINHNNGYYKVQDILNSLLFGATPTLHKSRVKCETVNGEVLLYEILICINNKGQLINCGGAQEANCGGLNADIKYLA